MEYSSRPARSLAYVARRPTVHRPMPRLARSSAPPSVSPVTVANSSHSVVSPSLTEVATPIAYTGPRAAEPIAVYDTSAAPKGSYPHAQRHTVGAMRYKTGMQVAKSASTALVSSEKRHLTPQIPPKRYPAAPSTDITNTVLRTIHAAQDEVAEAPVRAFSIRRSRHLKTGNVARQRIVYAMALCVFVFGMGVAAQGLLTNQQATEQVKVLSAQTDDTQATPVVTVPSEEKPKGDYLESYIVGPALPRLLSIPSIGVKARILQVGVDEHNQLGAPKNIYDSAWYAASAKPGEPGAMVIDGHYAGPTSHGVFSKLSRLQPGGIIEVERGDGEVLRYVVVKNETKQLDDVEMARLLVPVEASKPGLNLITCGGTYDARNNTFPARTVVYASQLP